MPKVFGKAEAEWRRWKDDVVAYLDKTFSGFADVLKDAETTTTDINDIWLLDMMQLYPDELVKKSEDLFWFLRTLTEGEARLVV